MELKRGYKLTEVGVIPEDWDVKKIGEITNTTAGGTPSTLIRQYWGGEIKWMSSGELHQRYVYDVASRITEEGLKNSSSKLIPPKCVLIGLAGQGKTRGTVAINMVELCTNQSIAAIFPSSAFIPEYLYFYLDSRYTELRKMSAGDGGRGGLNLHIINSISIPLPPLQEQRAIATALSDVDELLASLEALIEKKRMILQATMQELLTGRRRLPGFSGEWKHYKLHEVAQIISGGTPRTGVAEYWNGNIDWCTPTDITRSPGKYLLRTERQITELGLKSSSAQLLPKGALLLCTRATIGEVKISVREVCTNQGFKSLICSNLINNEFLYYLLLTMKQKLVEKAIGSTFLEISKKDIALLDLFVPPLHEQEAIKSVLSDMDTEIQALERQREKTRQIKQGMMQELLTGKTRLV